MAARQIVRAPPVRTFRLQFRLRSLLMLVAGAAVLIWAEETRRRWASYRRQAAIHALLQAESERNARMLRAELARRDRMIHRGLCGNGTRYRKAMRSVAAAEEAEAAKNARLAESYLRRW